MYNTIYVYLQEEAWSDDFQSTQNMFHRLHSVYYCQHHSAADIPQYSDVRAYMPSAALSCFNINSISS